MAAGGQHDQPAPLQVEGGGDFMPELIRDDRFRSLVFRQFVGVAAKTAIDANLHCAWGPHLLETGQANLARGEAMIGNN